jgi:hypothetical protein
MAKPACTHCVQALKFNDVHAHKSSLTLGYETPASRPSGQHGMALGHDSTQSHNPSADLCSNTHAPSTPEHACVTQWQCTVQRYDVAS